MPPLAGSARRVDLAVVAILALVSPVVAVMVTSQAATTSLAVVVGVVLFIASFVSVPFSLYVLIFASLLSPEFGSRDTSGSGVTLRLDDFLLLVIGFGQLARSAVNRDIGVFAETPLNRYITYYMLACAVSTGAGMVAGRVKPLTGFFFVLKYFEYFIVYFMLVNNLHDKAQAKRFLTAILLTAAIVSLVAIAQIPTGGRVVAPFEGDQGEPNTLGGYLILIMSITGGLLLSRNAIERLWVRVGLVALGGLMFVPILFTLSRAAWLAAIPVYGLFLVLSERRLMLILLLAAAALVAPYLIPQAVTERLFYTVETQDAAWARAEQEQILGITFDTSSSARIRSWRSAFEDFSKHPILGFGVTGWRFIDAQYLRVLLETGAIGLAAFLALISMTLKYSWRTYRDLDDPLLRGVALGFYIGTIGMMAHALMANTFIIVRIMEPFWLLAAIVIAAPSLGGESAHSESVPQPVSVDVVSHPRPLTSYGSSPARFRSGPRGPKSF